MKEVFSVSAIGSLELKNRFVRSATWEGMADEAGRPRPQYLETMIALARGGVGLIITGHAFVSPEGQATPWQLAIDRDDCREGLQEITAAVHAAGGKIVVQLAHAGFFAAAGITGRDRLVVSPQESQDPSPQKEIDKQGLQELLGAYAAAAGRARKAGFDGVQVHMAHGYLLSQFLSPAFNRRRDGYGGDIHNRSRIHREICGAIRDTVGKDYPLLIKLNAQDFIENGLTVPEAAAAARLMVDAGVDAVELSGGTIISGRLSPSRTKINAPEKEAYFREEARWLRENVQVPLLLVGGNRSYEVAAGLLAEGAADYISLSRPLIREADLIRRWEEGDRRPAACVSDNLCFAPAFEGRGIYCVTAERKAARSGKIVREEP
ncbi:MAG TPA: NADH:flavin oxidoreductase [Syntrophales bacterium]|nr:NADH:flavin oxidoreductase [Syntrophales bacterium]HPX82438.1 NADH:flavin oxidoreductase [Syntrophales bacterium]HQB13829.1 NADH:flavin oxidoreductase [Syntrophales bacterium]